MLDDIEIAKQLASEGVPIFLAKPSDEFPYGGSDGGGYWIPRNWQDTRPDPAILDDWEPGMAVCAVMGHVVDGVDKDPRSGGELPTDLQPRVYGRQITPSGGTHDLVAPLGVRSKDGVLPGIDVKAGHQGKGHGFLYIAPTRRVNHDGQLSGYSWDMRPSLEFLNLIGNDVSGVPLRDLINKSRRHTPNGAPSYEGPSFGQLSESQQVIARNSQKDRLDMWQTLLSDAVDWQDGERDHKGRGWEALTRDFAWAVASYAVTDWMPLAEDEAKDIFESYLPEPIRQDPKCGGKWYDGLLEKAAARPVELPPWADFDPVDALASKVLELPTQLDEKSMAEWLADIGLKKDWCWSSAFGWRNWTGRVWETYPEEAARKVVGDALRLVSIKASDLGVDHRIQKKLQNYLTYSKIQALTALMRSEVLVKPSEFDSRPDLLNVANGVVNLRTSELMPHNRDYMLTKITEVNYRPAASHSDWLKSLNALEPEVADWMQIRFGQAATGYMTSDDIMPIGQGQGSNGKTTLITAIRSAMGQHSVTVPDKLIHAGPSDHPTELTTLLGARMAFIDETPEAAHLNIPRLKAVLGSTEMTARKISKDNITWKPTHSLFVMTNYVPHVNETDHGTWRRLALVKFDKKFPRNDKFRARMTSGDPALLEAVLAWIVEGARKWYDNDRSIPPAPPKVRQDTEAWRRDSDLTEDYIDERLVFDPSKAVLSTELVEDFNNWVQLKGHKTWGSKLFYDRLSNCAPILANGVRKVKATKTASMLDDLDLKYGFEVPMKPVVWRGVRFRTEADNQLTTEQEELI